LSNSKHQQYTERRMICDQRAIPVPNSRVFLRTWLGTRYGATGTRFF